MESVFLCLMNVHNSLLFELLSVSVIRFSVYDQYASLVALLIFFLSDLNFSLRLLVSVGFSFILLNRWFLALISFFTSNVIQGGLSRVDDVRCGEQIDQ